MKLRVNALQAAGIDVRIDLRRRDIRMPQHLLHLAEIGASCQNVSCETVAKRMGADRRWSAGANCVLLDQFPDGLAS